MSNKKIDEEILMRKWYEENNDYNYQDLLGKIKKIESRILSLKWQDRKKI